MVTATSCQERRPTEQISDLNAHPLCYKERFEQKQKTEKYSKLHAVVINLYF